MNMTNIMNAIQHLKSWIELADAEMNVASKRVAMWTETWKDTSPSVINTAMLTEWHFSRFTRDAVFIGESLLRLVEVHSALLDEMKQAMRANVSHPYYLIADRILHAAAFARNLTDGRSRSTWVPSNYEWTSVGEQVAADPLYQLTTHLAINILNKTRVLEDSELLRWWSEKPNDESLQRSREQLRAGDLVLLMPALAEKQ